MNVQITAHEAIERGIWDQVCEMKGLNEWAVNEGMMDGDELLTFTEKEAKQLGLIKRDRYDD